MKINSKEVKRSYDFFRKKMEEPAVNAIALARAEVIAEALGWEFEWKLEEEDWASFLGPDEDIEDINEVLYVLLRDEDGEILQSLGGIADPTRDFARFMEAQLAMEELYQRGLLK